MKDKLAFFDKFEALPYGSASSAQRPSRTCLFLIYSIVHDKRFMRNENWASPLTEKVILFHLDVKYA